MLFLRHFLRHLKYHTSLHIHLVHPLFHFFFHAKKLECQKKCAHLVQIETKEESDWLAATFLNGNFVLS